MKLKNNRILLCIYLCVCIIAQSVLPGIQVFAANNEISGKLLLIRGGSDGVELKSGDELHQGDKIHFEYTFTTPDKIDSQQEVKIKIPEIFSFVGFKSKDIKQHITEQNDDGTTSKEYDVTCGKLSVNKSNDLIISLNSETVGNIDMSISLDASVDLPAMGDKDDNKVEYIIDGEEYEFNLIRDDASEKDEVKSPTIEKDGSYNNGIITWNLNVNLNQTTGSSVIINDVLENEQQLIEDKIKMPDNCTYEFDNNLLKFDLSDADRNKTLNFSYKTKLDASEYGSNYEDKVIHNKAELLIDYESVASSEKSLNIKSDWISKSAKVDKENKLVHWTIEVNNNNCKISEPKIIDKFPSKELLLKKGSVTLNGDALDENSYSIERSSENEPFTFTYKFKNDITSKQTLCFTTEVNNTEFTNDSLSFSNTANFEFKDGHSSRNEKSNECIAEVGRSVIDQKNTDLLPKDKQLTWEARINHNNANIKNGKISLTIDEGQELLDKSITINTKKVAWTLVSNGPGVGEPYIYTYEYTDTENSNVYKYIYNKNTRKLEFYFPSEINSEYFIGFNTTFTDLDKFKEYFADNNSSGKNIIHNVTLTGDDITAQNCDLSYTVQSDILGKTCTGYNYLTKEFSWMVNLNRRKIEIKDLLFTDNIPGKLELVDGSFAVKKSEEEPVIISNNDCLEGNAIKYELGTIDGEYEILYKTRIKDSSLKDMFVETNIDSHIVKGKDIDTVNVIGKNSAALYSESLKNGEIENIAADTKSNINRKSIIKEGSYNEECNCVDWEIIVNTNNINLSELTNSKEAKIEDILPNNVKLDLSSINLYELNIAENGDFSEGSKVDISKENIIYDEETNKFDFILPNKLDKPYKLIFSTDILSGSSIDNSAKLIMSGDFKEDDLKSDLRFSADGSGSGYGTIRCKKVIVDVKDVDTGESLEGVQIQLLNKFNDKVKEASTSDDGQVEFDKLKAKSEYSVKQDTFLKGYEMSDRPIGEPEINGNEIKYTIYNKKILRKISFFVKNNNNKPVKGSIFGIYNSNDELLKKAESDENGTTEFEDMPYGSYKIKQIYAPNGFNKTQEIVDVIVDDQTVDNKTGVNLNLKENIITNEAGVTNDFKITRTIKNEDGTKSPYANNEILLITLDGEIVGSGTTDDNGQLILEKIPSGDYFLIDKKAASGVKSSAPIKIHINDEENKATEYSDTAEKFKNDESVTSNVALVSINDTKELIKNAKFKIISDNGDYTDTQETDNNGVVLFNNLVPGEYTIKSLEVPSGYENNISIKVTVDKDFSGTDLNVVIFKNLTENVDVVSNDNYTSHGNSTKNNKHDHKHTSDEQKVSEDEITNDTISTNNKVNNKKENVDTDLDQYSDFNNNSDVYDSTKNNLEVKMYDNSNKKDSKANNFDTDKAYYKDKLPQAGYTFDTKILVILGLAFICVGLVIRNKKEINR